MNLNRFVDFIAMSIESLYLGIASYSIPTNIKALKTDLFGTRLKDKCNYALLFNEAFKTPFLVYILKSNEC